MTTTYSDEDLERLLFDLESDLVERKSSFRGDAPTTVREAVCAFANDLPNHRRGGVVFIGARDDGSVANLTVTDELLLALADIKTDGNILPPPTLTVSRRRLGGADLAVVIVEPSDSPPVRFRGRIWIRVGSRRAIATAQDERILNEKRRHGDYPYDLRPMRDTTVADLSRALFEDVYLPAAVAPDVLADNDRTYEERLAATKMIAAADDPAPTVLGLLVLGRRTREALPGAYIQFLRIAGSDLSDPIVDALLVEGALSDLLRRIDDKVIAHNRVAVDMTSGPIEQRRSPYPLAALQQLIRNAVMHRAYEATNAPVHVYWFDDRIEVRNPGGPYGSINRENFGRAGAVDYRNPNLAEAMRVLSFVQRYGVGIAIARRELARNGNPPMEVDIQPATITVVVRPAPSGIAPT